MKKILAGLLVILFAFSTAAFSTNLQTEKQVANATSPAQYQLQIDNPGPENRTYSISILSPKSSWFYYPNTVGVDSGSNQTVNITVSPVENAVQQRIRFDGKVRETQTGETREFTGFFNVEQPYKLHIVSLNQDREEVMPGEVINTDIEVRNLDNQPLSDYQVKAGYNDGEKTDSGTEILPGGTRRYEFAFKTDKDAAPGLQNINYTVTAEGKTQTTAQQTFTIREVENLSETSTEDNKILQYSKTLEVRNDGNSDSNASITAQIPSYLESITVTDPEPDRTEEVDGKTVYTWQQTLGPDQSFSATYQTNYWIPLAGIVLLAAGILAIKLLGKPVTLTKTVETDGEHIKINLEIENTGEKKFERLELREFIPDIATVDEKFSMNTPKVRKTNDGTKLTWKVEDLEPGDQRIIQYKIKPKVQVEEKVDFQKAEILDMEGNKMAESNKSSAEFNT